jgi:hypothetical protein
MAKAKRKDEAVVKASGGGKKKAAKAEAGAEKKAGGRKQAAAVEEQVVAEVKPEPASKKAAKAKAGVEKKKKPGGRKKAAAVEEVVTEVAPEPAGKKEAAKAKAGTEKKKAGDRKKQAAAEDQAEAEAKPEPASKKKAAKPKAGAEKKKAAARKTSKAKKSAKKPAGPTLAERLDRHRLYQLSVQSPEADLEFFVARYKELRGREPKVLREDFCGTAYISATWAGSAKGRRAIGVDLDAATLQWGRDHNLAPLSKDARKRVDLRQTNVLDGGGERSDITCAMNFSYGVFKTRAELKHYLEVVFQQLADDGVFLTELYGGTEAIVAVQDEREIEGDEESGGDFTYLWEQVSYNPITHETFCHIHFRLSDGSTIEKAFTYDWRLWSIMEVRELLYEVGFQSVRVYWETTDEDGDGTGEYEPTEEEENQESWLVYLVAAK